MAQNTEQIIKALEKEYDRHHKLEEDLKIELNIAKNLKKTLSLIKELQAHNENLQKENKYLRERLAEEAEIKEDMGECFFGVDFDIKALKADTVKKMRHELITRVGSYKDKGDTPCFGLFYRIITETTEELLSKDESEGKDGH